MSRPATGLVELASTRVQMSQRVTHVRLDRPARPRRREDLFTPSDAIVDRGRPAGDDRADLKSVCLVMQLTGLARMAQCALEGSLEGAGGPRPSRALL